MPIFRQKSHWAAKPYEWMDLLEVGMILFWGPNKTPRKIRAIGRNPWTDHLYDVTFAKVQRSWCKDPTVSYCRSEVRRFGQPLFTKVSLCTTDIECRLQQCIDANKAARERYLSSEDRYSQELFLQQCITQEETVGVVT